MVIAAWPISKQPRPKTSPFEIDIRHWDVTDMKEMVEEAHELVDHGLITEEDFRDYTFTNAATLYAGMNADFFKSTVCEVPVAKLMLGALQNTKQAVSA
jgi:hypothetical protein